MNQTVNTLLDTRVAAESGSFECAPSSAVIAALALVPAETCGEAIEYHGLVGTSSCMRDLFASLRRVEDTLVPVLVVGESGTGKELVARAVHHGSAVAKGALVIVDCGAIAPELIMSELFGASAGAAKGAIESAAGGTIILDEIEKLPLEAQRVLLRTIESGEIRTVGSERSVPVSARIIATTRLNLRKEALACRFREDLYHRIAVVELDVPALCDRPADVEVLARHFAESAGLASLPADLVARLRDYAWPGNVRELRNVVQAYAALGRLPVGALGDGTKATAKVKANADLDATLDEMIDVTQSYAAQKDALVELFTRRYLARLMDHNRGNQSAAARAAGLDRSWLWRLLERYGMGRR